MTLLRFFGGSREMVVTPSCRDGPPRMSNAGSVPVLDTRAGSEKANFYPSDDAIGRPSLPPHPAGASAPLSRKADEGVDRRGRCQGERVRSSRAGSPAVYGCESNDPSAGHPGEGLSRCGGGVCGGRSFDRGREASPTRSSDGPRLMETGEPLIQGDCARADPPPPKELLSVYGVQAQMLGPFRAAGR